MAHTKHGNALERRMDAGQVHYFLCGMVVRDGDELELNVDEDN